MMHSSSLEDTLASVRLAGAEVGEEVEEEEDEEEENPFADLPLAFDEPRHTQVQNDLLLIGWH